MGGWEREGLTANLMLMSVRGMDCHFRDGVVEVVVGVDAGVESSFGVGAGEGVATTSSTTTSFTTASGVTSMTSSMTSATGSTGVAGAAGAAGLGVRGTGLLDMKSNLGLSSSSLTSAAFLNSGVAGSMVGGG